MVLFDLLKSMKYTVCKEISNMFSCFEFGVKSWVMCFCMDWQFIFDPTEKYGRISSSGSRRAAQPQCHITPIYVFIDGDSYWHQHYSTFFSSASQQHWISELKLRKKVHGNSASMLEWLSLVMGSDFIIDTPLLVLIWRFPAKNIKVEHWHPGLI